MEPIGSWDSFILFSVLNTMGVFPNPVPGNAKLLHISAPSQCPDGLSVDPQVPDWERLH